MSRINQDKEIWRDIPNYEGLYQASNKGIIKTLWFWSNFTNQRHYREKILKPKISKDKCSRVDLWKGGEHKTYLTYRLVLCAFTGKPYDYEMTVNHRDGNRLNNNIENLEWMSKENNIKHAFENGLMPYPFVEVYSKETNELLFVGSKTIASLFLELNSGDISHKMKKGIFENDRCRWNYKE